MGISQTHPVWRIVVAIAVTALRVQYEFERQATISAHDTERLNEELGCHGTRKQIAMAVSVA